MQYQATEKNDDTLRLAMIRLAKSYGRYGYRKVAELLRVAGIPREPISVILRSGIPTNRKELERMAVDRAGQVIVLSDGADDSDAIKTLGLSARGGHVGYVSGPGRHWLDERVPALLLD